MILNSTSLKFINSNIELFKKCNLYLDDNNIESLKNYIFLFYKNIYEANLFFDSINSKIKKLVKKNITIKNKKKNEMWNSNFFPKNIKSYIENEKCNEILYLIPLKSRSYSLYFYFYNNDNDIEKVDFYMKIIYIWLYISNPYIKSDCSKNTNIYIYMTPFLKKIPIKKDNILDENNVNTAFTKGGCNINGEIIIYRKEEWFKVLLHECFHSFDFDFCMVDIDKAKFKLKKYFKVDSNIEIYESYCEVWARIMNCLIIAFVNLDNKNDLQYYLELVNIYLQIERIYSLKQCNLILDYMDLNYEDLFENNTFVEKTNVFCYYIISALLMNNYLFFIEWCYKNNKYFLNFSPKKNNINLFVNFIIKMARNNKIIYDLNCVDKNYNNNLMSKSSRMSIIEI